MKDPYKKQPCTDKEEEPLRRRVHEVIKGAVMTAKKTKRDNSANMRKQVEEEQRKVLGDAEIRAQETTALLRASNSVLENKEFTATAKEIFSQCKLITGATGGYVALLSDDGSENEVLFLDAGGRPCTVDNNLPMPIRGMREEAYKSGETVYRNDFSHSEWVQFLPEGHVTLDNVLFAPLSIEGKVAGILGLANKPGGFDDNDARMAAGFGEIAAVALHNSIIMESLGNSETRFRSLVQTASDAIISVNQEGKIILWNRGAESIFNYTDDEVIGQDLSVIIPQEYANLHREGISNAIKTELKHGGKALEIAGLRKDGSKFPIELTVTKWQTREGIFFTSVIRDITERKQAESSLRKAYDELGQRVQERTAELVRINEELSQQIQERMTVEEALRESETKHRIVADNTYDWEWWRDPRGLFIYNSPSCKRITMREAEEFTTDPDLLLKIIHPDDQSLFNRHNDEVEQKGGSGEMEFRILLPDGSLRWIFHACQPVYDENGHTLGRRGSNRDVTERKLAQQRLQESEKQLRHLSAQLLVTQETERRRISRELHDALGGALAFLKLRFRRIEKNLGVDQKALREEYNQNLQYIDQIIDDVRRISRDLSPSILEDIGFTAALNWMIDNFNKYHPTEATADIEPVDHLLLSKDKIALYRILQEALTNISKHAQAKHVFMKVKKDEDRISFFVQDDGQGFDMSQAANQEDTGRGLGLPIMHQRTRMLGGSLDLMSEQGKGTQITLMIPIRK